MLCPMTDNGKREMYREDFMKECIEIQNTGGCRACDEGKWARAGLKDRITPPGGLTFIEAQEGKKVTAAKTATPAGKPEKEKMNEDFWGDDRLKPIPGDVLQGLTMAGLKPYWKNEKLSLTCLNCTRSPITLPAQNCCWLCYDAGRGQQGIDLIEALYDAAKRAKAPKLRKKNPLKKKKQTPGPVAEKKATAPKQPLGVTPKLIWKQQRLDELHSGIGEHIKAGRLSEPCIAEWCQEVQELLQELV